MASSARMLSTIGCFVLLWLAVFSAAAHALDANWGGKPYKYLIVDQDLRDVLVEFGRNMNLPTQIVSPIGGRRVKGPVHLTADETAEQFLQRICEGYGLVWYFDGAVLHISASEETDTELIKLDRGKSGEVLRRLGELGLSDPRFSVRVAEAGGMLSVSGPPAYRSMVRKAVLMAHRKRTAREVKIEDIAEVHVFRGGS